MKHHRFYSRPTQKPYGSQAEQRFAKLLEAAGIEFVPQYRIRFRTYSYWLDFYIRYVMIGVEIDGPLHDKPERKARDIIRDSEILRQGQVKRIVRLSLFQARARNCYELIDSLLLQQKRNRARHEMRRSINFCFVVDESTPQWLR